MWTSANYTQRGAKSGALSINGTSGQSYRHTKADFAARPAIGQDRDLPIKWLLLINDSTNSCTYT